MAILETAIKQREGMPPWFAQHAASLAGAVGRVSVGGRAFGTGFLVAPHLIPTCCHVVPDAKTATTGVIEFDYQREEDGGFRRVTTGKLHPQRYFVADQALDFALVALETEFQARPVIPITGDGHAAPGELVSLFHHPLGGPLQLSLRAGAILASYDDVLHHSAGTQPGSAGAPLLDENLRLVGVHHASVKRGGERARTTPASGTGMFIANEAIRASAILPALEHVEPLRFGQPETAVGTSISRPTTAQVSAATAELVDTGAPAARDSVFISYARADQGKRKWRERLRTFLLPFGQDLDVWDDSRIETGAQWRTEIDIALKRARIAVLLVGPSFLGSEFIAKNELPPLLSAAAEDGVKVLPLITNHCSYERTALGKYQAFNDPKKPLEAMELAEQNRWLQRFAERIDEAFRSLTGRS